MVRWIVGWINGWMFGCTIWLIYCGGSLLKGIGKILDLS